MGYLLGNDQFRYFLTYKNVRTRIVFSPEGWEKNSKVGYKRNLEYWGVFRSWGLPLDFVYDGADILRNAYHNGGGIQAQVRIEVEELNTETLEYDLGFVGDIDFSGKKDNGTVFSVTLMEAGATEEIQSRDDIKYEFPLVGSDVVNMTLPGVAFNEASDSIFESQLDQRNRYIPDTTIAGESFQSGFVEVQNVEAEDINDTGFSGSSNWFVKSNRIQQVRVKGSFKGQFVQGTSAKGFSIRVMDNNNIVYATLYSNNTLGTGEFQFDFDVSLFLIVDQKLFFYFRTDVYPGTSFLNVLEGTFNVSYNSVSDPSNCLGIKAPDFFKRVMAKVSPSSNAESYLLSTKWKDLIFTSGDGIREIDGAKIKFSLKDLYQTFNGIESAAIGIEQGIVRLELSNYFARPSEICNVGEVSECEFDPATELMMSEIRIGYKDGNTDNENGKQEYNSGQIYETPLSRVQNPVDWTSAARADQYGIEKIRIDYNVKKSEKGTYDTGSDNDTFMVDCYYDSVSLTYKPILGSSYDLVEGLTSPLTAYNLNLTPKHNLFRKGNYLRSIFFELEDRFINFASGDKNTEVRVVDNGVSISEKQNVMVGSLPENFFQPEKAKIKCMLPFGARKLFDAVPFGYITWIWKDVTFKGYILECNVDIAKNTEQEFELLLTNNNDMARYVNRTKGK